MIYVKQGNKRQLRLREPREPSVKTKLSPQVVMNILCKTRQQRQLRGTYLLWVLRCDHDRLLWITPLLASLPSLGERRVRGKFQASSHGLVFSVTSPHPGPHPGSPHFNKRHSYHPENFKRFSHPVSGTWVKDQILEQQVLWLLRNLQGVPCQNQEYQYVYFYYITTSNQTFFCTWTNSISKLAHHQSLPTDTANQLLVIFKWAFLFF